jgi:hypothetical protein
VAKRKAAADAAASRQADHDGQPPDQQR